MSALAYRNPCKYDLYNFFIKNLNSIHIYK